MTPTEALSTWNNETINDYRTLRNTVEWNDALNYSIMDETNKDYGGLKFADRINRKNQRFFTQERNKNNAYSNDSSRELSLSLQRIEELEHKNEKNQSFIKLCESDRK